MEKPTEKSGAEELHTFHSNIISINSICSRLTRIQLRIENKRDVCNKWKRTPIAEQAPTEARYIINIDHV